MNSRRILDYLSPPAFIVGVVAACSSQPVTAKQAEAEGAYGAALLACVDDAGTLAESKACRAKVDLAWGIKQTPAIPPDMFVQSPYFIDGGVRDGGAK